MIEIFNRYILGTLLPAALTSCGIYLGIYSGLWHPRRLAVGIGLLFRGRDNRQKSNIGTESEPRLGNNSPARALALALAGTLGVGNIAGVSAAIWAGGPGAVFWMLVSAVFATSLKYSETLLGIKHRTNTRGEIRGGAPAYISDAFASATHPRRGIRMDQLFAILCIFNAIGMGCMIQVNAAAGALFGSLGISPRIFGAVMAAAVFFIASGGADRISSVCGMIVPFVSLGFFIVSVIALILRADELPRTISYILKDAFDLADSNGSGTAVRILGGIFGFFTSRAVRCGFSRGLISNEAGSGTSPLAHSTADTDSAVRQGILGITEVLVDTLLLAAATALVVLTNYDAAIIYSRDPAMMTIAAYAAALGEWAVLPLAASVWLFAFATVACWAFYGRECLSVLVIKASNRRRAILLFNIIYALSAYLGAVMTAGSAWAIADLVIGIMTIINLAALIKLRREVRTETMCIGTSDRHGDK